MKCTLCNSILDEKITTYAGAKPFCVVCYKRVIYLSRLCSSTIKQYLKYNNYHNLNKETIKVIKELSDENLEGIED